MTRKRKQAALENDEDTIAEDTCQDVQPAAKKMKKTLPTIYLLPKDCFVVIMSFLTPFELTHVVNSTCKLFSTMTCADELWRQFTLHRFDAISKNMRHLPLVPTAKKSWKSVYKSLAAEMPIDENQFFVSKKDVEHNVKCPFCGKILREDLYNEEAHLLCDCGFAVRELFVSTDEEREDFETCLCGSKESTACKYFCIICNFAICTRCPTMARAYQCPSCNYRFCLCDACSDGDVHCVRCAFFIRNLYDDESDENDAPLYSFNPNDDDEDAAPTSDDDDNDENVEAETNKDANGAAGAPSEMQE